jgi:hypothetical protein
MDQFSSLNILFIISFIILIFSIPFLFISTLQNTIKATNPKNRTIEPYEVWLYFIPVIGLFFHFNHILKITNTLKSDFEYKNTNHDNERLFGANFGLTYCLINIGYFFYLVYKISTLPNYSSIETQYLIYDDYERNFLPLMLGVLFIVSGICFIVFWSKMSNCKRILTSMNNGVNDHYKNDSNQNIDYKSNNIKEKSCLKCGVDSPFEHKFCAECGSSEFQLNSINSKQSDEIIIDDNEKECPNCNVIINKNHHKCEFCDYDFELKQVNIVDKDSYSDGKSRIKVFIFTVIMLFILFVTWFIGYYNQNKNIENNEIVNEVEIDAKPLNSSTETEEVNINQSTCANCGNLFNGFGYMMISEGNCIPCSEENSVDCEFCSEACGIEYDKKSTERYNKILNENGYDSLNENEENNNQSNTNCSFNSGGDVLAYLIGKTFRQKGGSVSIRFSTDGAIISGSEQYQWISYQSLGGHKGYVKLASVNPSHPDGTIKLWVSCRDNTVTDGETVLLYD